jgi:hypothetical protein
MKPRIIILLTFKSTFENLIEYLHIDYKKSNLLDWRGEDFKSLLSSWLDELIYYSEKDLPTVQVVFKNKIYLSLNI